MDRLLIVMGNILGGLYGQVVNWKRVMDGVHTYVLGGLYGQVVTGNKVPHSQCSTWLLVSLSCLWSESLPPPPLPPPLPDRLP